MAKEANAASVNSAQEAGAAGLNRAQEAGAASANGPEERDPSNGASAKADAKGSAKQKFKTRSTVVVDGEIHAPGATVSLTREAHASLFALGAIEDDWK